MLWVPCSVWVFSPAESDGQLCGVAPAQDEEPPACPDEFDDFVTFEASGTYRGAEREFDVTVFLYGHLVVPRPFLQEVAGRAGQCSPCSSCIPLGALGAPLLPI